MTALLFLLLAVLLDNHPEIGTALEGKVEHTYSCAFHTATFWEREPGGVWVVTDVHRNPTGRDCAPGEPFDPDEEGM